MCVSDCNELGQPEKMCAVCDVMEIVCLDCIRISEKTGTHVFG